MLLHEEFGAQQLLKGGHRARRFGASVLITEVEPRLLRPRLSMQLDAQSADDLENRVDSGASVTR